jgi:CheY-like chemotaxis protein
LWFFPVIDMREIPVVALMSLSEPAMRRSIAEAGAESCCVKPLDPDQFVRQVEALLPLANKPAE